MSLRVGIIQINVTDLDQAWEFYVETLGFAAERTMGLGKAFELNVGTPGPKLLIYPAERQVERDYPNETGVTIVFYTDDIKGTVAAWRAKGVSFSPIEWSRDDSGIGDSPFGAFIGFHDPFGNVHELLEPR